MNMTRWLINRFYSCMLSSDKKVLQKPEPELGSTPAHLLSIKPSLPDKRANSERPVKEKQNVIGLITWKVFGNLTAPC